MISAWGCCTIGVLGIATSVNPYMLITFIFIAGKNNNSIIICNSIILLINILEYYFNSYSICIK